MKTTMTSDIPVGRLAAEHPLATRVFARRQRTWLRDEPVTWLDPNALGDDALGALLEEPPRATL